MTKNFKTLSYLQNGSKRQMQAYNELRGIAVFEELQAFRPLLAGTIPIGINLATSDLDIICHCSDHEIFGNKLTELYGNKPAFKIGTRLKRGIPATIARFEGRYFQIEIFGQDIPSEEQNAWRHMMIEHKILQSQDEAFRLEIIRLKASGLSTEEAFAKLLGIDGDPYEGLLEFGRKTKN